MRALEVMLNGKKVCVAGFEDGVVTAIIGLVDRAGQTEDFFEVHGSDGPNPGTFNQWEYRPIVVGDELTVRVIETDSVDEPKRTMSAAELWPEKFGDQKY